MGTVVAFLGFACLGTISLILLLRPHFLRSYTARLKSAPAPVQPDIPPLSKHDDLGLLRKRGGQRVHGEGSTGSKTDRRRRKASPIASGDTHFRVRPGRSQNGPPTWDPYAEDQSSSHRVRELRRGQSPRRHHGPDYYEILGVGASATTQEIEAAYRRSAARVHPDRYFADPDRRMEAEKALKRINAAVQVLRDPARRARYDARRGPQ